MRSRHGKKAAAAATAAPEPAAPAAPASSSSEEEGPSVEQPAKKRQKKEVVVPEPEVLCFCPSSTAVRLGTSGYSYKRWRGPSGFYGGLPQRLEFECYAKAFDFVEINGTFYGWFEASTYDSWRDRHAVQQAAAVRPTFQYALKAPQLYTHRKRLNVDDKFRSSWAQFWERCQRLGPHLGPVLFQFPPNFRTTSAKGKETVCNLQKLRELGEVLPASGKFVFEFRDASWLCSEVYDALREHNWCLAIAHLTDGPGKQKLEEGGWIGSLSPGPNPKPEHYPMTCDWGVYVRFHGSAGQYTGAHGAAEMKRWARWAKKWAAQGRCTYMAFNNDTIEEGGELPSAILDCRDAAAALRAAGVWT